MEGGAAFWLSNAERGLGPALKYPTGAKKAGIFKTLDCISNNKFHVCTV